MPETSNVKRKPVKFFETKVLLATTSLAITMGLWTLFSRESLQVELSAPLPESAPPDHAVELDLPPLPTLVPLVNLPDATQSQASSPAQPAAAPQDASLAQPLRSVSAEEGPVIVQKFKPVVDLAAPTGDDGGGSQPVASTRSSR